MCRYLAVNWVEMLLTLWMVWVAGGCQPLPAPTPAPQWETVEISLQASDTYTNPYTEVAVSACFVNQKGDSLYRPGVWDGDNHWKIRFASPDAESEWRWQSWSVPADPGLSSQGILQASSSSSSTGLNQKGLLGMSAGKRNVIHADGSPFLMIGDTPWALPFRAQTRQAAHYAAYRQEQGFNTALLMVIQPDMRSTGPDARDTPQGFARGFQDLSDGHIRELQPGYFQYLDSLADILLSHDIVPVYQPVFHGFGWKGEGVLGNVIEAEDYVRFCRYLLARYGSKPAFWLLAGDNGGRDPGVREAGEMLEAEDAYHQPTGLHYNPCDDFVAEWAKNNPLKHCMHFNKTYQAEAWLDFQWAQTGHGGEHQLHKVERMYDNLPTKAVANGEPTYEGMANGRNGLGWWQGEEAWLQLMSGGTMGVVYGAASLWQWKVRSDESGWTDWANQPKAWHEALEMEGAQYVGLLGKILKDLDWTDIERHQALTGGQHLLLAKPGQLYISYLPTGGSIQITDLPADLIYRWVDPRSGETAGSGISSSKEILTAPQDGPLVLLVGK